MGDPYFTPGQPLVLDRKGLDVAAVEAHKLENGTLEGYTGAETIASDAVLELECEKSGPHHGNVRGARYYDGPPNPRLQ